MPQGTPASAADPSLARYEIVYFGAAVLHGAEEEQVSEQSARYKIQARFAEVATFYKAIYSSQKGMVVDVDQDTQTIAVAVANRVEEADFSTLVVTPHPAGEPNRFQVMIMPRGEPEASDEDYPDSSPWADPA